MGFIQKDALRTMVINFLGLFLGYLNKGVLFVLILNTEKIGLMNLMVSMGLLFGQLSNLGAINAISRFLPFFKEDKSQTQSFLILNLFFVFIGVGVFSLLVFILQTPISSFYSAKSALFIDYYYWLIPIGIANVLFSIFDSYLKAMYKNVLSVFLNEFLLRFLVTVSICLLAFDNINFNQFFIINCFIYFVPVIVLVIYLLKTKELKLHQKRLNISKKFKKIIVSYSLYSYTNTLGSMIVFALDALMITYFLGLKATGIYTTVVYLTSALQVPYKALIRISSPLIPQFWKDKSMAKMEALYVKVSSISLIISLYLFMVVWCNIDDLFSFYKPEFLPGIWVFFFIMIGKMIDMFFGLNGFILLTSKKFKFDNLFTLILLLLVFSLNCWLIPIYGIIGAAISTSLAIVIYNLLRLAFVYFIYKIHPFEKDQFKIIFLFSLILSLFWLFPDLNIDRLIQIPLKVISITVLFFGIIILLKWNIELNKYIDNVYFKMFKKDLKLSNK